MESTTTAEAPSGTTEASTNSNSAAQSGNLLANASSNVQAQASAKPATTESGEFWVKPDGTFAEGWQKNLPEDIRDSKSLSFKDLNSVFRTVVHQQKMIGAEKLPLPGKDAKPEDWDRVWNRLGRPEKPDGYNLDSIPKLPEDLPYNYDKEKSFVSEMHKLGLTQTQLQGIIGKYRADVGNEFGSIQQQKAQTQEKVIGELKQELGQAFGPKLSKANQFVRTVAGEKAEGLMEKYGNDPDFIKFAIRASESMQEDGLVTGKSTTADSVLSPSEARSEIAQIRADAMKDRSHPLNGNKTHPQYAEIKARWDRLHTFLR